MLNASAKKLIENKELSITQDINLSNSLNGDSFWILVSLCSYDWKQQTPNPEKKFFVDYLLVLVQVIVRVPLIQRNSTIHE